MINNQKSIFEAARKSSIQIEYFLRDIREQISHRTYFGNRIYFYLKSDQLLDLYRYRNLWDNIKLFRPAVKNFQFVDDKAIYFELDNLDYDYRTPDNPLHNSSSTIDILNSLNLLFQTEFFSRLNPDQIKELEIIGTIGGHGLLEYDNDADICYLILRAGWYGYSNERLYFENESFFLRFILNDGIKYQFNEESLYLAVSIPNTKSLPKKPLVISFNFLNQEDLGFFPIKPIIYSLDLKNRATTLVLSFGSNSHGQTKIIIDSSVINDNPKIKEIYFDSECELVESSHRILSDLPTKMFVVQENQKLIELFIKLDIKHIIISKEDLMNQLDQE